VPSPYTRGRSNYTVSLTSPITSSSTATRSQFPQDEHERLLIARLEELGVSVERQTELLSYHDQGDRIAARLRRPDSREDLCEADYIAGCDGVHSIVRETMGTGFPGGTYRHLFYVADVQARGPAINGELHVDLEEPGF
jgi:2-polyprenyl-6-methoxyphenol hydroxylase-like FAD-dependent oxidoreductase